jgi:HD-GYP domain-containing protein (c-di-GMP phosphodiesterase class II)
MPKTVIENVASPHSGVKVFKIGGTLGFHEKNTLAKLLQECEKRGIAKLVIDFSELKSLGGGCARILLDKANAGEISIGVAGASETTLQFFQKKGETCQIHFASTIEEAISTINNDASGENVQQVDQDAISREEPAETRDAEKEPADDPVQPSDDAADLPKVICLGHDMDDRPDCATNMPDAPVADEKETPQQDDPGDEFQGDAARAKKSPAGNRLTKKLFHYDALLSISSEFNRISDLTRLLDNFLLTTMAQVGVEHVAFFKLQDDVMVPVAARGIELEQCISLTMTRVVWNTFISEENPELVEFAHSTICEELQERMISLGFVWAVPFLIYEELRGMILLGRPIRKSLDEDSFEVLKILVHHASIAYENKRRFEEASYRSLGLIQTLISLIEERNNLVGGSTFFVANYSFITAKKINYPEENISDLMFGIVLRDIGMIKVSDLILKNPRELNNEEWEIIKQHPIDGAKMLKKMKFSDHAVKIVLHHHERFNGEGYPYNLRRGEIPLGARIVSVVESFGAMLQERPTRPALSQEEALNAIRENWGMRYDPEVVRIFEEIIEEEVQAGKKMQCTDSELFEIRGDLLCRKAFS